MCPYYKPPKPVCNAGNKLFDIDVAKTKVFCNTDSKYLKCLIYNHVVSDKGNQ